MKDILSLLTVVAIIFSGCDKYKISSEEYKTESATHKITNDQFVLNYSSDIKYPLVSNDIFVVLDEIHLLSSIYLKNRCDEYDTSTYELFCNFPKEPKNFFEHHKYCRAVYSNIRELNRVVKYLAEN